MVMDRGGSSTSTLGGQWGPWVSKGGLVTKKIFVSYMCKCAVFDIKPTNNHQIFIPGVHLHSPVGGLWGSLTLTKGGMAHAPPLRTTPGYGAGF